MRLAGKCAVVLGASRGIGRGIATRLEREGARVITLSRTPSDEHPVLGDAPLEFRRCDARDLVDLEGGLRGAHEELGGLDILVNNVGTSLAGSVMDVTSVDLDAVWTLNVRAVLMSTRWGAEATAASKSGRSIINITSSAPSRAYPDRAGYCATKAAVLMGSKAASLDLAPLGIRVNCVAPGAVDTPLLRQLHTSAHTSAAEQDDAIAEFGRALAPLGRAGRVEDVASAVVYLGSDGASWVTGTELQVDGGITA